MDDLFADHDASLQRREVLAEGAVVLRGRAYARVAEFLALIDAVSMQSPFRRMSTPGGYLMSVDMTCCGRLGWVSDESGYRYSAADPHTGKPWPDMPEALRDFAVASAADAGFSGFRPDACLINRYRPGAKLSLHQDRDEPDLSAPIVSVSLGLPATFLFGGLRRSDPQQRIGLVSGDVVVWGGPARLRHHAVLPVRDGEHPLAGRFRINLTFRKASRS